MPAAFDHFFQTATGNTPYDYQCRLACGEPTCPEPVERGRTTGGDAGTACTSQLISIPTGLGKTAAVVLAWLWNRIAHPDAAHRDTWPRRLVICLPMRTLVDQTETAARDWLLALKLDHIGVHTLMGGEDSGEWDLYPERNAILIGTQDMLLSRALNRGYAAGRARWPKDFALLNNDCLWVFDEVQLMSTGFATSLQLQAWRERVEMKPAKATFSWWMSATVEKEWLNTAVDFAPHIDRIWPGAEQQKKLLWEADLLGNSPAAKRVKELLTPGTKKFHRDDEAKLLTDKLPDYIEKAAKAVKERMKEHPEKKVLIIVNTVKRACALAEALKGEAPLLLHSRFRHRERKVWASKLKLEKLIIATQVVEAGVDISSRILFTELCPWPSFIQRCGRAARYPGEEADIYWLDVSKEPVPYPEEELIAAKEQLEKLTDVSLDGIRAHRKTLSEEQVTRLLPYAPRFVPQSKEILEFFDTTPDLTGADVDISRYIRDGDEHDVTVFWRDCSELSQGKEPTKHKSWQPEHAELCPVPIWNPDSGFRAFAQKAQGRIWRWDYRDGWTLLYRGDAERIFPGQVFLLEKSCGGYDPKKGWTGEAEDQDFEAGPWKQPASPPAAGQGTDDDSTASGDNTDSGEATSSSGPNGQWRTILSHSKEVCHELAQQPTDFLPSDLDADARIVMPLAARLHDWGKAHLAFKDKVKREKLEQAVAAGLDGLPAKAPEDCWRRKKPQFQPADTPESERDHRRTGYRHELASALAILELLHAYHPENPSLAWPDAELRAEFGHAQVNASPLPSNPLADEIAKLTPEQFNLLLFLVAAHHGKVRLSLRSSPDDLRDDVPWPCPPDKRQARGVREGDPLPEIKLPGADFASSTMDAPALTLHLDVMDLGLSPAYGPSWRERMGALLAAHGPFRLAWYEAVLRVADQRASKLAETNPSTA